MIRPVEVDQLTAVFSSAREWLLVPPELEGSAACALSAMLKRLLGTAICDTVCSTGDDPASHALMEQVETQLRHETEAGTFDPGEHDAKLLFLCAGILATHGYSAHGIRDFASEVGTALTGLSHVPLAFRAEAVLLARLGYAHRPNMQSVGLDCLCHDPFGLLRADANDVRAMCRRIAAATEFGLIPLRGNAIERQKLSQALTAILLHSLRDYNLSLGVVVLRTIAYLRRPIRPPLDSAVTFLLGQQHDDGKFGYLAEDYTRDSSDPGFDLVAELHLPLTVACLWTLGEVLVPGFRLFDLARLDVGTSSRPVLASSAPTQHRVALRSAIRTEEVLSNPSRQCARRGVANDP